MSIRLALKKMTEFFLSRKISDKGLALIKEYEGFAKLRDDGMVEAYPDPASGGEPFTIGWGSTGPDIKQGTVWTVEQCEERFRKHVQQFDMAVSEMAGDHGTQGMHDALVSFAYNLGPHALRGSTLLKLHNMKHYKDAADQFGHWVFAKGRRMRGLVRRRAAERELYLS